MKNTHTNTNTNTWKDNKKNINKMKIHNFV